MLKVHANEVGEGQVGIYESDLCELRAGVENDVRKRGSPEHSGIVRRSTGPELRTNYGSPVQIRILELRVSGIRAAEVRPAEIGIDKVGAS